LRGEPQKRQPLTTAAFLALSQLSDDWLVEGTDSDKLIEITSIAGDRRPARRLTNSCVKGSDQAGIEFERPSVMFLVDRKLVARPQDHLDAKTAH